MTSNSDIEYRLDIQSHKLIPTTFWKVIPWCTPSGSRVVDEHGKTISPLLQIGDEFLTTGLVLKIGNDVFALARSKFVETVCGLDCMSGGRSKLHFPKFTFCNSDSFLLAMNTFAPFWTKACAAISPRPVEPPVT
jgi:hypothetical protein